jgi:hypothetical protein
MKELAPHTTPLLLASWRLIPAGVAVLAWAAKEGRPYPKELMGWVAVALFGLVDGAFFQVGVDTRATELIRKQAGGRAGLCQRWVWPGGRLATMRCKT